MIYCVAEYNENTKKRRKKNYMHSVCVCVCLLDLVIDRRRFVINKH